jgi:hypothetical protein
MPRNIFGLKTDKIAGDWSKLQNKELHDLYSSPNIIGVVKSRGIRGQGTWHIWRRRKCIQGFDWKT